MWAKASEYAPIALSLVQLAPTWPNSVPGLTCWQSSHNGDDFDGPIQPFGRLCHYKSRDAHALAADTKPGLFLGWKLQTGVRFRQVLLVADLRSTIEDLSKCDVPVQGGLSSSEVYFPSGEPIFPLANLRDRAINSGQTLKDDTLAIDDYEFKGALPWDELFDDEAEPSVPTSPEFKLRKPVEVRITMNRILQFGSSVHLGCPACDYTKGRQDA